MDRLHQVGGVAILLPQLDPVLRPDAEFVEHGLEFATGAGRVVLPATTERVRPTLDDASSLERPQPGRQEALRDAPDAMLDLAEVVPVEEDDLAQDERRPAFGEHLAGERDRADLLVAHDVSVAHEPGDASADLAPTTPTVALAGRAPGRHPDGVVAMAATDRHEGASDDGPVLPDPQVARHQPPDHRGRCISRRGDLARPSEHLHPTGPGTDPAGVRRFGSAIAPSGRAARTSTRSSRRRSWASCPSYWTSSVSE